MSKLKEFAEFILEVEKCGGFYQRRKDSDSEWVTYRIEQCITHLDYEEFWVGDLRLKPKEEKKKIPLEFSDITPNTVFSIYKNKGWFKIYSANEDGVETPIQNTEFELRSLSYKDLMTYYYSEDGKTWKGCYKYEN